MFFWVGGGRLVGIFVVSFLLRYTLKSTKIQTQTNPPIPPNPKSTPHQKLPIPSKKPQKTPSPAPQHPQPQPQPHLQNPPKNPNAPLESAQPAYLKHPNMIPQKKYNDI